MRTLKALCAVATLSTTAIVVLSLSAEARCAYGGCKGPIVGTKVNTSYNYNTVRHEQNVTRYRDIYRRHPVVNINRIVTVTRATTHHGANVFAFRRTFGSSDQIGVCCV
jgi:hypothetical protein